MLVWSFTNSDKKNERLRNILNSRSIKFFRNDYILLVLIVILDMLLVAIADMMRFFFSTKNLSKNVMYI